MREYNLKWQITRNLNGVRPHLPVPWLYNSAVSDARYIYIHNRNYPHNTEGCLLMGTNLGSDMVGASVDALRRFKRYLDPVGIQNVKLRLRQTFSSL